MTYQPTAYADADSADVMRADCRAVRVGIRRRQGVEVRDPAPSRGTLESESHRTTTPRVRIGDDAARIATALHLHLD